MLLEDCVWDFICVWIFVNELYKYLMGYLLCNIVTIVNDILMNSISVGLKLAWMVNDKD